ncbi:MAG: Rieske (2Fe-2S) protein, partial [Acidothermales bacterium]|nr:Rieske (2Fe-2S) protein [Acidothermales bacterium]
IFGDDKVVVTQPEAGTFMAFTAVCTHQGCIVASVADGTITCDCHGSQYDAATGEVTRGPATAGLAEQAITVEGNQILLG